MCNKNSAPKVFWVSEPVKPGETILIAGGNFPSEPHLEFSPNGKDWTVAQIIQNSDISIKAILPESLPFAPLQGRIGNACGFLVNHPDVWWIQGTGGLSRGRVGEPLRIFGNCLSLNEKAHVSLGEREVEAEYASNFEIRLSVPADFPVGESLLKIGSLFCGKIHISKKEPDLRPAIDLADYGVDPTGQRDSTLAFVQAMERARCLAHGAIIQIPRGIFRIDSNLRPMTFMNSQLFVMENTELRGEGQELTSLWWTDRDEALPCLLELEHGASIRDFTIYAQGKLHDVIQCGSEAEIERITVRASSAFMLTPLEPDSSHRGRKLPATGEQGGFAVEAWGQNNRIADCDFVCKGGIRIFNGRGSVISGNRIQAPMPYQLIGSSFVFENNSCDGGILGGGGNIALWGSSINRNICFQNNTIRNVYCGDREALTFDGHGTRFFGGVSDITPDSFRPRFRSTGGGTPKGMMNTFDGTVAYIIDGTGIGQYRFVRKVEADGRVVLERPWEIPPDENSLIQVGAFNGHHLILNNRFIDAGAAVQLYPVNLGNIVAGNESIRTEGFFALSQLHVAPETRKMEQFEPSWYNQFLKNKIREGGNWGRLNRADCGRQLAEGRCWLYAISAAATFDPAGNHVGFRELDAESLRELLGEAAPRKRCLSGLRFSVVRGFDVENNGSVVLDGAVTDLVVENCYIANSERGIVVTNRLPFDCYCGSGQPFQYPDSILLRGNRFHNVCAPYSGDAVDRAVILEWNRENTGEEDDGGRHLPEPHCC